MKIGKLETPVVRYREFAPSPCLARHILAYFSFTVAEREDDVPHRPILRETVFGANDSFSSPGFADGQVSMVFSFDKACHAGEGWKPAAERPCASVIGPMTAVGSTAIGERLEAIGVYFRAAQAQRFTSVPGSELTDRNLNLEDLWGHSASGLLSCLHEAGSDAARIDQLEAFLWKRAAPPRDLSTPIDLSRLAAWMLRRRGRMTVQDLAHGAGVSRQYLTRVFHEHVGVTPNVYLRLARFHAGLVYAECGEPVNWAQAALELGYADQSHMIAEYRRFSSLTPEMLVSRRWFHPFIERARARFSPPCARSISPAGTAADNLGRLPLNRYPTC
jgi:AraC-like DNA-binding protein